MCACYLLWHKETCCFLRSDPSTVYDYLNTISRETNIRKRITGRQPLGQVIFACFLSTAPYNVEQGNRRTSGHLTHTRQVMRERHKQHRGGIKTTQVRGWGSTTLPVVLDPILVSSRAPAYLQCDRISLFLPKRASSPLDAGSCSGTKHEYTGEETTSY